MKLKRILSLLASAAMAVTAVTGAMSVSAVKAEKENFDPDAYYTSGECGTTATWLINTDCTLIISGSGEMSKCYEAPAPSGSYTIPYWGWEKASTEIQKLVVEEGISLKDDYSFSSFGNITEAVFPSTITNLYKCLSQNMSELKDLWIFTKDLENTFNDNNLVFYPNAGSGTKWHIYQSSKTEKSLRDGLKLTDDDIEYITEEQKFPEIENRTPIEVPEVTDKSGPCGLTTKYEWNSSTKTLTFSGTGNIVNSNNYYEKYKDVTEHIVIESGITSISAISGISPGMGKVPGAFYDFTALKDVDLPDTLINTGRGTFCDCTSLTSFVSGLPEGLKEIGDASFSHSALSGDLILPKSLNSIGRDAFAYTEITSINSLNEGMFIGGHAFESCNSLKEVTIPKNVTLGSSSSPNGNGDDCGTFKNCISLEKAIIEEGLIDNYNHGYRAIFLSCTLLKDVYIFADMQEIYGPKTNANNTGYSTFYNCDNVKFHIYKDSVTEKALRDAGYLKEATEETEANYVYLSNTTALETAISEAEAIETDKYTDESVATLTKAIENAKAILDNMDATQDEVDSAVKAINEAKNALEEKKDDPSESDPSTPSDSSDPTSPSNPTSPTNPTGGNVKKTTSPAQRASQAKAAAEKAIKQAKIVSLTTKAKGKKKITVSWKKVAKAAGYEVQASTKKNFKKDLINKATTKNKVVFKKLKSKKKYFVRVRAYATYKDAKGKTQKVYSKWVKSKKKVKVK